MPRRGLSDSVALDRRRSGMYRNVISPLDSETAGKRAFRSSQLGNQGV